MNLYRSTRPHEHPPSVPRLEPREVREAGGGEVVSLALGVVQEIFGYLRADAVLPVIVVVGAAEAVPPPPGRRPARQGASLRGGSIVDAHVHTRKRNAHVY